MIAALTIFGTSWQVVVITLGLAGLATWIAILMTCDWRAGVDDDQSENGPFQN